MSKLDKSNDIKFLQSLNILYIKVTFEDYYSTTQEEKDDLTELTSLTSVVEIKENTEPMKDRNIKIFISHSSKDEEIVKAFVNLLTDIGIKDPNQLFCSSYPPFDVKLNDDIFETLKEQYQKYSLYMIYMLSNNYYQSPVSLNEMGAGWVLQYDYLCVLLPGFSPNDVKGCVNNRKKAMLLDSDKLKYELNTFKDSLVNMMGVPAIDNNLWEQKRDQFIDSIR